MKPTFITWLWEPRGGWREGADYSPQIIQGVQHMLRAALPDCRHVCIADTVFEPELSRLGIESFPLWDIHGRERTERHGFDCHARLGLWGAPGALLAEYLKTDQVQWLDADVMVRPTAGATLLDRWHIEPEMFWVPRGVEQLESNFTFGKNQNTWLGVNGSMVRLKLGSRPDWWKALKSKSWLAETEAHICGSDQAAITRLLLESMGLPWKKGNAEILLVPRFDNSRVVAHGMWTNNYDVAFFPYDLTTDYTKPWLSNNAFLRREYRVLAGFATEEERRAQEHPGLRRYMGKRP